MTSDINELIGLLANLKRVLPTNNLSAIRLAADKAIEKTVAILQEHEQRISNLEKPKQ